MTFLLMFTTIAPNVSMFGGAGETADAATSDGNTYKVLGIMAEYSDAQWLNARNTWIKTIENRITSVIPSANITMKVVNSYANIKYCMTGKRECQVIQSQSEKMSKFMSKHTKAEKIV